MTANEQYRDERPRSEMRTASSYCSLPQEEREADVLWRIDIINIQCCLKTLMNNLGSTSHTTQHKEYYKGRVLKKKLWNTVT